MNHTCIQCGFSYSVTEEDLAFLKKLSPVINDVRYDIPPPRCCPDCRFQRRLAIRNESKLYNKRCDLTGEEFVSLYSQDSPHKAYKQDVWWSDSWNPFEYGRDIDFSRPFFEQLHELKLAVPRRGMQQGATLENCEYTTYTDYCKNCYLTFACGYCENVYNSSWLVMCNSCIDCYSCVSSELLYECADCVNCYNCFFLQDCYGCQDSYFLENCRNCHHSICCKNLRSKGYHIFNQPVSKEKYEALQKELHERGIKAMQKKFIEWSNTLPTLYAHLISSENCTGNMIEHANNCYNCFDIILGAQDLRHCQVCGWKGKDMMDCFGTGKESELMYEITGALRSQRALFSSSVQMSSDCFYCDCIKHIQYCFGCIGINHRKFCILNKQYTKEQYEELVPRLIKHMNSTGEWGENIPIAYSPFCYNETIAMEYFPLSKQEALTKGLRWKDEIIERPDVQKIIPAEKLPIKIDDIPDEILNWAIECEETKKPYFITAQELLLYRRMRLSIPKTHPDQRHLARRKRRLPSKLWKRTCDRCNRSIETPYQPGTPQRIYCEPCFLHETYHSDHKENIAGDDTHVLNQKMLNQARVSYSKFSNTARAAQKVIAAKLNR
ncbi:hypothetical protein HYV57_01295 [Candidatus Peregrinibacteria bacterium]|nr:hypothetical protein [Candidatus Peregrinibacteria bacterium]